MQDSSKSPHQVLQNSAENVGRKGRSGIHGRPYEREPGPNNFQAIRLSKPSPSEGFSSTAALLQQWACPCKKQLTNTGKQTGNLFLAQAELHQQGTAFEILLKPDPRGNANTEVQFSHCNCISTWKFLLAQIPGAGINTSKPAKKSAEH